MVEGREPDPTTSRRGEGGSVGPDETGATRDAPQRGEVVADFFALGEIFHRVLATADEELSRPNGLLFWSGVAGGLVLGLSLLARAAVTALAPGHDPLVGNLLYPIGFVILILGRYQLFTENTLTPVTLVLTRLATFPDLLRVWGTVLAGNLLGAFFFAAILGPFQVLSPEAHTLAVEFGVHLVSDSFMGAFGKAILAGWLMAVIVWLVHAARETLARIVLIWLLIYLQVTADLFHCIVGGLEVMYAVLQGAVGPGAFFADFLGPVLLGNTVGGVVFVAILNWVQIGEGTDQFAGRGERLDARAWLFDRVRS